MDNLEVKIVKIEPMRVASVYAFGTSPEIEAWKKLMDWAKQAGIGDDRAAHPIFGFSNPCTPNASGCYGYEVWMKVGSEIEPSGDTRIEEFLGGKYAVTRCETHGDPGTTIPGTWQRLLQWSWDTSTKTGYHQELERFITNGDDPHNLVLDLCLPIVE